MISERAVIVLKFHDPQNMLCARRADRDHHDAIRPQLLQERRRYVIDTTGDDDLVEWCLFFPAIISIGILAVIALYSV